MYLLILQEADSQAETDPLFPRVSYLCFFIVIFILFKKPTLFRSQVKDKLCRFGKTYGYIKEGFSQRVSSFVGSTSW